MTLIKYSCLETGFKKTRSWKLGLKKPKEQIPALGRIFVLAHLVKRILVRVQNQKVTGSSLQMYGII